MPVTVVVPCYNEELSLAYLANTLDSLSDGYLAAGDKTKALEYAERARTPVSE